MIRFRTLPIGQLNAWLSPQVTSSVNPRYRLRVRHESRANLAPLLADLRAYIDECFDDARTSLRAGFADPLSPFNVPVPDPAANYPNLLHIITLQGYFGEILSGLAVEHWGAFGENDWKVPAFLFRLHVAEFQHLEVVRQRLAEGENHNPDNVGERRPGRTGDDCLAFRIDNRGAIIDVLALEAKCLSAHSAATVNEAHAKLSAGSQLPPGVRELIGILAQYDTPIAQQWQAALLALWKGDYRTVGRRDGVAYACSQKPIARTTWLPLNAPNTRYTARRELEGLEFQLDDLAALIMAVY
jgi:hypothetical protein